MALCLVRWTKRVGSGIFELQHVEVFLSLPVSPIISNYHRILLCDQANYDQAPFLVIELEDHLSSWTNLYHIHVFLLYLLIGCSGNALGFRRISQFYDCKT